MHPSVRLILICSLLQAGVNAQSVPQQYSLTGFVRDSSTHKPVVYATLTVLDTLGNAVASAYSLESGLYKISMTRPGSFTLEVSTVGYQLRKADVHVAANQYNTRLPDIFLLRGNEILREVTVTSRKRLVEKKPGMLVYNAENDLANKGGTAADVLRKAPILSVDAQGNVSMRGSTNLKILINGKYSGQMARSVSDALNMMPADIIKSIEIITTPSAKYDAEGAAGVINIITKKGKGNKSGTVELSASNLEQMLNPRISLSNEKWDVNFSGHLHRLRRKSEDLLTRTSFFDNEPAGNLQQTIRKDNTAPHGSGDLSIDYTPDEKTEISLGMTTWFGRWPDNSFSDNTVTASDGAISSQYLQNIANAASYLGTDVNLSYTRKLKKQGQQITLLLQHSPSRDLSDYDAIETSTNRGPLYRELNHSRTMNHQWTVQADYNHPLNTKATVVLDAGAKLILRHVKNTYDVYASDTLQIEKLSLQQDRSDDFRYSQNVFAAYSMLKVSMENHWYVEAGARLESTYLNGEFKYNGADFNNRFFNFIPTATISKKINDESTLNLSYTKRLTRPYIWDLNPNVNASDPKNIVSGNPALQPELANQADLSYNLNKDQRFFINAAFFWKQTNNAIVEFTRTDSNGISYTSKQNLSANKQFGANISATINLSANLMLNSNININHLNFTSAALDIARSGWGGTFNANSTYKFSHGFSTQVFGEYTAGAVTLLGKMGQLYYYSFSGKKEIKEARMNVTLSAVNLFSRYTSQTENKYRPDFVSFENNRQYNRSVKLTVNWEFGGQHQQRKGKRIENNDINSQGKG